MRLFFKKKIVILFIGLLITFLGGIFFYGKFSEPFTKEISLISKENGEKGDFIPALDSEKEEIMFSESTNLENEEKRDQVNNVEEKKTERVENLSPQPQIINKLVGWGFEEDNGRKIDTIIIHSSYNALGGDEYDLEKLLKEYKSYGVAPHYLIDRKGNIFQLVQDKNIAYHAGASKVPDGRTNVNNFSIGIELMNTKTDKYSGDQYKSLKYLIAYIKSQYKIKYTLGHNDIAKGRKDDPWNFDWDKLK